MRRLTAPRLCDWEARLHDHVAAAFERPHAYGPHDCMVGTVGGCVEAVTGVDIGRAHRGKYRSAASATRYLRSLGFDSPEALLDVLLEQKAIGFAQRGDLALVPGNALPGMPVGWAIPAVVYGEYALAIGSDGERGGLHRVPRGEWLKAYAVGDDFGG